MLHVTLCSSSYFGGRGIPFHFTEFASEIIVIDAQHKLTDAVFAWCIEVMEEVTPFRVRHKETFRGKDNTGEPSTMFIFQIIHEYLNAWFVRDTASVPYQLTFALDFLFCIIRQEVGIVVDISNNLHALIVWLMTDVRG